MNERSNTNRPDDALSDDQLGTVTAVTDHFFTQSSWISGKILRGLVPGESREAQNAHIHSLMPRYLRKQYDTPNDVYAPTFEGALRSGRAPWVEAHLAALLDVLKQRFSADRGFDHFSWAEIVAAHEDRSALSLSDDDAEQASTLFTWLDLAHRTYAADEGPAWSTPAHVEELVELASVDALVQWVHARMPSAVASQPESVATSNELIAPAPEATEPASAPLDQRDAQSSQAPEDSKPKTAVADQTIKELLSSLRPGHLHKVVTVLLGLLVIVATGGFGVGYWVRGVEDNGKLAAASAMIAARTAPPPTPTATSVQAASVASRGSGVTLRPRPDPNDAAVACPQLELPPRVEQHFDYCIEVARGATPSTSSTTVMEIAEHAHDQLGIYWRGNPPAAANRILPINGGADDRVHAARWYGVSYSIGMSVCAFLRCREWQGEERGVQKVCDVLPKKKCR